MDEIVAVEDYSNSNVVKLDMSPLNIVIEQNVLAKALSHIQSIVERRNIIPILSNVKVEARGEFLELTATDMDISITERIPAQVIVEGATTISAHTFYDIIRKLSDKDQINICKNENTRGKLCISAGKSNFHLSYLDSTDFPVMDHGDLPYQFTISAKDLLKMIDKNRLTISTEETRYNLNGMYLHQTMINDQLILKSAATDGHRLSCYYIALPDGAENIPGIIIPRKAVLELRKILDNSDSIIAIALSSNKIRFIVDDIVLISKLIDGNFPDYENLIPKNNNISLTMSKEDFAKALDRVSTINMEKTRAVKFSIQNDQLLLSATADDQSKAEEFLVVNSNCNSLEIGFNSRYLNDIINSISGEEIEFVFSDALSPTIIRDVSDPFSCFVVMPMRV